LPTAIPTVNAGETIESVAWGNVIKAFIDYLHTGRTVASSTYVGSANLTTTLATWADADATNLIVTLTPTSTRVRVTFIFNATAAGGYAEFDIYSVGLTARFGDATHGITSCIQNAQSQIKVEALFTGLTANVAQSFKLQYRSVTAGQTSTIYNNAYPVTMIAEEC